MYPINRDRDIRELEVVVFGGVPEVPQPVYERDTYAYSEVRRTRKSRLGTYNHELGGMRSDLDLGSIRLNTETGEFVILAPDPEGVDKK